MKNIQLFLEAVFIMSAVLIGVIFAVKMIIVLASMLIGVVMAV